MAEYFRIAAVALAVLAFAAPARAEVDTAQKAEIEAIVRDYLLANPEILEEAYDVLQKRRDAAESEARSKAIAESSALIFDSENQMVLGNPEGDVTLVEFFDYNCGYCRHAVADMTALLEANPDLRIVMKEFPILSQGSVEAARVSVAIKEIAPDRYLEFHQELFARPGEASATKALEVAGDLGLDVEALKAAAAKTEVTDNIKEVHELATRLGMNGTPSYVIGTEIVPGAIGYDSLQAKVTAVRTCGATVC